MRLITFLAVICFTAAACPSGQYSFKSASGETCIKLVAGTHVQWSSAQSLCKHYGGRLVVLDNIAKLVFVNGLRALYHPDAGDFWIGAKKIGRDWFWMRDVTTTLKVVQNGFWNPGQPDGTNTCACMWRKTGSKTKWDDMPCSDPKNYICEKEN